MEEVPSPRAVLVVDELPEEIELDFLVLYFENERRSGGGPVRSCKQRGRSVLLEFEHQDDAERVLSKTDHILQNVQLQVRRAAPSDPRRVLLKGLNPRTSPELLEMYIENMTKRKSGEFEIIRSFAGDQALIQLQEPLDDEEMQSLEERLRHRKLDGESVEMERLPRTEKVLLRNLSPLISQDLLELYFESKRSGGGNVREVKLLLGERGAAIVAFQDWQAVERVLKREHRLQDHRLHVSPYYDFLQLQEELLAQDPAQPLPALHQDAAVPESTFLNITEPVKLQLLIRSPVLQELRAAFPDVTLETDENGVQICGTDAVRRRELQNRLLEFLRGIVQAHVPMEAQAVTLLQRTDVQEQLEQLLKQRQLVATCEASECVLTLSAASGPALSQARSLLLAALCEFSVPVSDDHVEILSSQEWQKLQETLSCCSVTLAEAGDCVKVITLKNFVQENTEKLQGFLVDQALHETVVPMEPSVLSYLQLYYHEVLQDLTVTIIPLEGEDISGFRISGDPLACQTAAELLRTLIGSLISHPVSLRLAGVSRFLSDERGQQLLRQVESRFQCVIAGRMQWTPLDTEHDLDSQNPLMASPNFERNSLPCTYIRKDPEITLNNVSVPDLEKIKNFVATIKMEDEMSEPSSLTGSTGHREPSALLTQGAASEPLTNAWEEETKDLDLYTDQIASEAPASDLNPEVASKEMFPLDSGKEWNNLADCGQDDDKDLERAIQLSLAHNARVDDLEEEAQLLFAIQRSMDVRTQSLEEEDEEVRKVLEISLQSYQQEACLPSALQGDGLEVALEASIKDAMQDGSEAQLTIISSKDCDMDEIAAHLQQEIHSRVKEERVENGCLQQLPKQYQTYLTYLQRKHAVHISLDCSTATIHGFLEYPIYASRDLMRLLNRVLQEKQEELQKGVHWVWYKQPTRAVPYPAAASTFIEQAWRQQNKQLDIFFDNKPYTIDFERMEEYSLGTGQTVAIQRVASTSSILPEEGLSETEQQVELQPVDESTEEYRQVVRPFYDTMEDFQNKIKIIKVERLSNTLLYKQYRLKKQCMVGAGCQQPVERRLYHGTSEASSREICHYGFNRSFCGKNATLYGQGAYFAAKSVMSVQDFYSPRSPEGNKYIFVVKVLTGDFTAGSPDLKVPPLKENSLHLLRYDSVVDNITNPTIFVIFNDTQAYPEYLITCQRI
uniref:Poly [ADP-ribose] polymerase n=1 Tax=Geotrypetes seraphini TaxID=260995 RepID=A0A6P8QTN9_GEOSA|nr:protein mono-ADP-ribosyltransferase PARP10 [Geotrypetes seraphini]XP_033789907.1 protein mono-ADP-ribosyltransferase PARP10 [Geotrypetes seraphini]XP_033789908.1 protein mono-ADP-ribosyltransferase PARP10 [Geotrypetes seraphini]